MSTISQVKEQAVTDTPLLLFDCSLANGATERWSTHAVAVGGHPYAARVIKHSVFEFQSASDQAVDSIPRVSLDLANADSHFSEIERSLGFKGAKITVSFVFYDLRNNVAATSTAVVFQGIVNSPDLITESMFRLSAINRLSMQRVLLPPVRIQRRCAWEFPVTASDREEALNGGTQGKYSRFYRCGYSADQIGGIGNLSGGAPFTSCSYTRSDCETRGMFYKDLAGHPTARFGGLEFVPSTIQVRSAGEKGSHLATVSDNEARYNDFVPLIYGTAWYSPSIAFSRNDGNLTRMEILLGMGEMQEVIKVLVNDIDMPVGRSGQNMTGTGWFSVISLGTRQGSFNTDFSTGPGVPAGDPYGSMGVLSVVVPNRINDGRSLPAVKVLINGLKIPLYGADGSYAGEQFSNNPAWIILDILQRSGWRLAEMDLNSFATAADYCGEAIATQDLNGNAITIPRFECNLVIRSRRSAGDIVRGIRNSSRLYLAYGFKGLLQLRIENSIALQQPAKREGSNASETLNGGWPAYEFGDGSGGVSGILRNSDGSSSVRMWSRSAADSPNRFTAEFQDAFNGYQQDSLSVVDPADIVKTGQEITGTFSVLGLPNFDQTARILQFNLDKSIRGNSTIEFQTSVKALGLTSGDIITLTYLKEGFLRQPVRITKLALGPNYRTTVITAQIHDDSWYYDTNGQIPGDLGGGRQPIFALGLPRPIAGSRVDTDGTLQFSVAESSTQSPEGITTLLATVGFTTPAAVTVDGPGIPFISLSATVSPTGGTLADGQTVYYSVSCVNAAAQESALSFVVRATIATSSPNNTVTLKSLSFASSATHFHVYRGTTPSQLYRIATDIPLAGEFTDTGLAQQPNLPPDPNFDHVNVYGRLELLPESPATTSSTTSIGNSALQMIANEYQGMTVRITRGTGAPQERTAVENTDKVLTVSPAWDVQPDSTSYFVVAQPGYQLGATTKTNRVQFAIPNRSGQTIELSGRSANANDTECPYEISPVTRWTIGGAGLKSVDADVPPAPVFGLDAPASSEGTIEIGAIGFPDLTNTTSITAGTLTLHHYNELDGLPTQFPSIAIEALDTTIDVNVAGAALPDSLIQIESEILRVDAVLNSGLRYNVTRGMHNTIAVAHSISAGLYVLAKTVLVVPFVRNFFGTPASGSWSYPVVLPNIRVASAELFVTNSQGDSPTTVISFMQTISRGLRTLSGGQFSFQVPGFLAIQTAATPDVSVDAPHAVQDVYAVVNQAPTGTGIQVRINLNSAPYCVLNIDAGNTVSLPVNGLTLPPLKPEDRLGLDVLAVGQTAPGSDLTVVIRL